MVIGPVVEVQGADMLHRYLGKQETHHIYKKKKRVSAGVEGQNR